MYMTNREYKRFWKDLANIEPTELLKAVEQVVAALCLHDLKKQETNLKAVVKIADSFYPNGLSTSAAFNKAIAKSAKLAPCIMQKVDPFASRAIMYSILALKDRRVIALLRELDPHGALLSYTELFSSLSAALTFEWSEVRQASFNELNLQLTEQLSIAMANKDCTESRIKAQTLLMRMLDLLSNPTKSKELQKQLTRCRAGLYAINVIARNRTQNRESGAEASEVAPTITMALLWQCVKKRIGRNGESVASHQSTVYGWQKGIGFPKKPYLWHEVRQWVNENKHYDIGSPPSISS